jgi:hypothetical protein
MALMKPLNGDDESDAIDGGELHGDVSRFSVTRREVGGKAQRLDEHFERRFTGAKPRTSGKRSAGAFPGLDAQRQVAGALSQA